MTLTRPLQPMLAAVKQALETNKLWENYQARPPYQRNDYLSWINRAQREATKKKRLEQMIKELRDGREYMGMRWR